MSADTIKLRTEQIGTKAELWVIDLLGQFGPSVLFVICMASCLALPVPASLVIISAAALAASGDMALWHIALACVLGAVTGDVLAYVIGRAGRGPLVRWLDARPKRRAAREKAESWVDRHGGPGILLSRWPLSPLGPYVNYAAGAIGYRWARFVAWSAGGEFVWVGVNLTLGYVFADQIAGVAMVLHEATGVILSLLALALILWALHRYSRRESDL